MRRFDKNLFVYFKISPLVDSKSHFLKAEPFNRRAPSCREQSRLRLDAVPRLKFDADAVDGFFETC